MSIDQHIERLTDERDELSDEATRNTIDSLRDQLIEAHAIATTMRAELAESEEQRDKSANAWHDMMKERDRYHGQAEELRVERDNWIQQTAQLEAERDTLARLLRERPTPETERAGNYERDVRPRDAGYAAWTARVDAALAGGGDAPPAKPLGVCPDNHPYCHSRFGYECNCSDTKPVAGVETDIAAQVAAKLAEPDFQKKLGEAVERVKETQRQLDRSRRIDPLDLLRPYGATTPADTARITKEPKR
jgi:hypothetical protein